MDANIARLGVIGLLTLLISSLLANSLWASPAGQTVFGTNPNSYLTAWVAVECMVLLFVVVLRAVFQAIGWLISRMLGLG